MIRSLLDERKACLPAGRETPMDKVTGRVVRSKVEWTAIIEAQERAGISAAGFCSQHNISYKNFLYHRGKVLKKSSRALAIARSAGIDSIAGRRVFIPVRVNEDSGIRLRFPRGLVLETDELPPASWVAEVGRQWIGVESC